jgi:hypothetical protein
MFSRVWYFMPSFSALGRLRSPEKDRESWKKRKRGREAGKERMKRKEREKGGREGRRKEGEKERNVCCLNHPMYGILLQ